MYNNPCNKIKGMFENEYYIKFIKDHIRIANDIIDIGHEICGPLPLFGFFLLIVSIVVKSGIEFLERELNAQSFFIGELLINLSIGLTFWYLMVYGMQLRI